MAIINNAPKNEAVMSNVGEIGEFRIRNSAKAFNILSSGLYANKIRAIIRELSCNAYDSHIAAGKPSVPFDIHLPNSLEPWFSVRDYGTGLTHEQVTKIYTTYFESTKTGSNDFVGALGLGSKSPFSYTDNFTVTAIKDGTKGIYSAFINEQGVPSIALMFSEKSEDPAGVEVKFAVNDQYDFRKFAMEAAIVLTYFALRPVVSGVVDFQVREVEYDRKDIIPGVHSLKSHSRISVAVMGNIAYPVEVPNAEQTLGNLRHLLGCGLEMHFDIGELDFQASREGLSYIPQTIEAIKNKLSALNDALEAVIATEADAIPNMWTRALFLYERASSGLWTAAVSSYALKGGCSLFDGSASHWRALRRFQVDEELLDKLNISMSGFVKSRNDVTCRNFSADRDYTTNKKRWGISVTEDTVFVINDTKIGALERTKYHFRVNRVSGTVYVLSPKDKTKPMDTAELFKLLSDPPVVMQVSTLTEKPRDGSVTNAANVTIMRLVSKDNGYYRYRSSGDRVWRDAGKLSAFSDTETYYYLPLSGYALVSAYGAKDPKEVVSLLERSGIPNAVTQVYGVRKTDIENIKAKANWINLEDYIVKLLNSVNTNVVDGLARRILQSRHSINFTITNRMENALKHLPATSPFHSVVKVLKAPDTELNETYTQRLDALYKTPGTANFRTLAEKLATETYRLLSNYPMLKFIGEARRDEAMVVEYIKSCDALAEKSEVTVQAY